MTSQTNLSPSSNIEQTAEDKKLQETAQEQAEQVKSGKVTIEQVTGYSTAELQIIKTHVVKDKNVSDAEVVFACMKGNKIGLSVLNGEIWFYKDWQGNLISFAGKDGFMKLAHLNKDFNGLRSCEVRKNDAFKMNVPAGIVDHTFGVEERGDFVGAYAIAFRKGGEPTVEWADIKTYKKEFKNKQGGVIKTPWVTHTEEMIKKVAEIHAIKRAFGIVGLYHEAEFGGDPAQFLAHKEEKKIDTRSPQEKFQARKDTLKVKKEEKKAEEKPQEENIEDGQIVPEALEKTAEQEAEEKRLAWEEDCRRQEAKQNGK